MDGTVIYAPQGAGKTRNAEALARAYGKRRVLDQWAPGAPIPSDALALTNVDGVPGAVDLVDALRLLGDLQ